MSIGDLEEDADDEGIEGEPQGEEGERFGAEKEADFVRKIETRNFQVRRRWKNTE